MQSPVYPCVHQGWWLPSNVACYPLQALAWACYPLVCLCASLLPPWGIVPSPRCRPLLQWLLHCTTLLPPCSSLISWLLVTRWEIALSVTRLLLSKLLPTYLGACPFQCLDMLLFWFGCQWPADKWMQKRRSIIPDQIETRHHGKKKLQSFQMKPEEMLTQVTIGVCKFKGILHVKTNFASNLIFWVVMRQGVGQLARKGWNTTKTDQRGSKKTHTWY